MNFSSDAMADFEGLLEVNRKICKQQMAEKASLTLQTNCAVLPYIHIAFKPRAIRMIPGVSPFANAAESVCIRRIFSTKKTV